MTSATPGRTAASGSGSTEMTDERRDEQAAQLVDRFSMWAGAAGLIPVPFVDIAAVGGLQLQMLRRLSEIYGVPFSDNRGKSIIASLAGSVLPASTATTAAMSVMSALKTFPGVGTAVSALTMSAVSAGATWVIGKVFIQHFASGGTLLDFNPPDYREFIKAQKEKWNDAGRNDRPCLTVRPRRGAECGWPTEHLIGVCRNRAVAVAAGGCGDRASPTAVAEMENKAQCSNHCRHHLSDILPARRAVRHPPPHGLSGHVPAVARHYARAGAVAAHFDRASRIAPSGIADRRATE